MTRYFKVGKIVNTHGIQGEVRVITSSDFSEDRYKKGNILYFFKDERSEPVPLTIKTHRTHKLFDLLTFENHPNINDVVNYKGGILKVNEEERGALEEGEYYYNQIIGCEVISDTGEKLGQIKEILAPGANDVWVVQRYGPGKDILLPYIPDCIKEVNIQEKQVIVHILEGLI